MSVRPDLESVLPLFLSPAAESLVRTIIAQLLDKLDPFALGHLARPITKTMLEQLDQITDNDAFVGDLFQNFGWLDDRASSGGRGA